MAKFDKVVRALMQGQSVRRDKWESLIRIFLSSDTLMCQRGAEKPWSCALSGEEISAKDWRLFKDAATTPEMKQAVTGVPLPFVMRASKQALPQPYGEARAH